MRNGEPRDLDTYNDQWAEGEAERQAALEDDEPGDGPSAPEDYLPGFDEETHDVGTCDCATCVDLRAKARRIEGEIWTIANALERNGDLMDAGDLRAMSIGCRRLFGGEGLPRESKMAWLRAQVIRLNEELKLIRNEPKREAEFAVKWAKNAMRRERAARIKSLLDQRRTIEDLLRRLRVTR